MTEVMPDCPSCGNDLLYATTNDYGFHCDGCNADWEPQINEDGLQLV